MKLLYKDISLVSEEKIAKYREKLAGYLDHLCEVSLRNNYDDPESSLNLPFDESLLKSVRDLKEKMVTPQLKYIIDIGIGGSSLGTKAVYDALFGTFDILLPKRYPKMIFADTVDPEFMGKLFHLLKSENLVPEEVLLCVISKSGVTTETLADFETVFSPDLASRVAVITDSDSKLFLSARERSFPVLPIPKLVGGRFSILSAVGLFPLCACGVDISALIDGAKASRADLETPLISAAVLYENWCTGKIINNNFFFHPELESIGKWYRQLMGESLGKKGLGIIPVVSVGSTDLHSMGQLYLGGQNNETTTFVSTQEMGKIMGAILSGVKIAYQKLNLPFIEVVLDDLTPKSLGEFFQFKMIEMMYLGQLMEVNTFDQPNVESYKIETREILSKG